MEFVSSRRVLVIALFGLSLVVLAAIAVRARAGSVANARFASGSTVTVAVTRVVNKSLGREVTLSSELVPFQEIDVYAKESGCEGFEGRLRKPRESWSGYGDSRFQS